MKIQDIEDLNERERRILSSSFYVNALDDRMRYVTIDVILVLAVLAFLFVFDAPLWAWGALVVSFVVIAAIEKASYVRSSMIHRSIVRKLVHRVEQLEGVRLTPENAAPVEVATATRKSQRPGEAQMGR